MKSNKVADWLQSLGNLGIVLGLIFVGFQLYQDRQLKLAELSAAYFEARIQANAAAMGDTPYRSIVKAAMNPSSMTPEDAYIFLLNQDNWRSLDMRYAALEGIGLGPNNWQEYSGLPLESKTPMGIRDTKYWMTKSNNFPQEFRDKVHQELEQPGQENPLLLMACVLL